MEHTSRWNLTVGQAPTPLLDEHTIEHHRLRDGAGFPPSYLSFVRTFGWGRLHGLWLVYPPPLFPRGSATAWWAEAGI
ncbi:hypothetical protein [Microbacterium maritypicum]|uniref:hypothetical protein n=1 Tax=Microbacterium maritypicum TaxID=33918 RepID=UPI003CE8939D